MNIGTIYAHAEAGENIKCSMSNFKSFMVVEFDKPFKIQIFVQNLQDLINFKNNFLSSFNKLMKEVKNG